MIYFGLILNELLANTIKHNNKESFSIKIHVLNDLNKYVFVYEDQQKLPESTEAGTGIQLIKDLVRRVDGDELLINHHGLRDAT